jgi:hypothetical protein
MPLGTLIELGPMAMIELTGLRTPCVLIDRFQAGLKRQVLSWDETGPPLKCGVLGVYGPADRSRPATPRGFGYRRPGFAPCRLCNSPVNNSANLWLNRDAAVTSWHFSDRRCPFVHKKADVRPPLQVHGFTTLGRVFKH